MDGDDETPWRAFDTVDNAAYLFRAPAKNVVMMKVAYWLDR